VDLAELQALTESREVLEQFANNADIAFWVATPDVSKYFYMSPGYEKIWGRSCESLHENPHSFLDAVHPDDLQRVIDTAIGGDPCNMDEEYRILRPDGELLWVRDRTFPVKDDTGNVYRMIGIAEDITSRKQAEIALLQSEEKFRQFANHAEILFWVCEPDVSKFHYVSPGYEKIWGRKCAEIYENPRSFLDSVHPDDKERVIAAAVGENSCNMDEEYRIFRPDGSIRWVSDRTFPIYDEQGNLFRMAGVAEDITQRKQVEEETYKILQRERELSESKSNFIATTSHEIRTPLAAIQSSIDLLQHYDDRLTEDKKQVHFQKIETGIKRITQIVQDVLLLSESEAGTLQFQPEDIDVVKLCQDVVTAVIQSGNNPDRIEFNFSGDISQTFSLDPKLFNHILTNLLENSLKYSPQDSKIQFDLNCTQNEVIFTIKDRGMGIPREDLSHIFDSFYRAKNVRTLSGTGLGLSIVKKCVDLHKGEISVNSIVGEGTTFFVTLRSA
jgi:PAS domain S-box-containing protein